LLVKVMPNPNDLPLMSLGAQVWHCPDSRVFRPGYPMASANPLIDAGIILPDGKCSNGGSERCIRASEHLISYAWKARQMQLSANRRIPDAGYVRMRGSYARF